MAIHCWGAEPGHQEDMMEEKKNPSANIKKVLPRNVKSSADSKLKIVHGKKRMKTRKNKLTKIIKQSLPKQIRPAITFTLG